MLLKVWSFRLCLERRKYGFLSSSCERMGSFVAHDDYARKGSVEKRGMFRKLL